MKKALLLVIFLFLVSIVLAGCLTQVSKQVDKLLWGEKPSGGGTGEGTSQGTTDCTPGKTYEQNGVKWTIVGPETYKGKQMCHYTATNPTSGGKVDYYQALDNTYACTVMTLSGQTTEQCCDDKGQCTQPTTAGGSGTGTGGTTGGTTATQCTAGYKYEQQGVTWAVDGVRTYKGKQMCHATGTDTSTGMKGDYYQALDNSYACLVTTSNGISMEVCCDSKGQCTQPTQVSGTGSGGSTSTTGGTATGTASGDCTPGKQMEYGDITVTTVSLTTYSGKQMCHYTGYDPELGATIDVYKTLDGNYWCTVATAGSQSAKQCCDKTTGQCTSG
ncbi:MAG: hypothetical protein HZA83_00120 [Thaumarchaeota archaeon]|nr:hypothetical protein [Nitrososphaerota archaeon]